jgi:hypothetical protein
MSGMRRLTHAAEVAILVDGEQVTAWAGDSVATALLAAGRSAFGAAGPGEPPRAPYCLMGVCFGCLCRIDGRPGEQACLWPVREGLIVETRDG